MHRELFNRHAKGYGMVSILMCGLVRVRHDAGAMGLVIGGFQSKMGISFLGGKNVSVHVV